jgi:hypothetical protein
MKVATFTVRADARQSARWKQAAEADGFNSAGAWLAGAADAYLKLRAKAGLPLPLAWRIATFPAVLESGETVTVRGKVAPPFAYFEGTEDGTPEGRPRRRYTLVYLPSGKILATLWHAKDVKILASELARLWVRWGGSEPTEDPAPLLQRFQREDT